MPKGQPEQLRFWSKVKIGEENECWEWEASKDKDGYGWFTFESGKGTDLTNTKKTVSAHRYSLMLKLNNFDLPTEVQARHTCDNRGCVNPNHLREGSAADNSADMVERNRQACGEKQHSSVLTEEQAKAILIQYRADKQSARLYGSLQRLATHFNVDKQVVSRLTAGKTWKHLPRD